MDTLNTNKYKKKIYQRLLQELQIMELEGTGLIPLWMKPRLESFSIYQATYYRLEWKIFVDATRNFTKHAL